MAAISLESIGATRPLHLWQVSRSSAKTRSRKHRDCAGEFKVGQSANSLVTSKRACCERCWALHFRLGLGFRRRADPLLLLFLARTKPASCDSADEALWKGVSSRRVLAPYERRPVGRHELEEG